MAVQAISVIECATLCALFLSRRVTVLQCVMWVGWLVGCAKPDCERYCVIECVRFVIDVAKSGGAQAIGSRSGQLWQLG